eukprot:6032009-Pleurochrysis_carterae.AAC.1
MHPRALVRVRRRLRTRTRSPAGMNACILSGCELALLRQNILGDIKSPYGTSYLSKSVEYRSKIKAGPGSSTDYAAAFLAPGARTKKRGPV